MKAKAQGVHKFWDNGTTETPPGQGSNFRDCPGHSRTVGNYGILCYWDLGVSQQENGNMEEEEEEEEEEKANKKRGELGREGEGNF